MPKIRRNQQNTPVSGRASTVNVAGDYTTSSTSYTYIDSTNFKTTLNCKGGTVLVFVQISNFWNTSAGYDPSFAVGMDGLSTVQGNSSVITGTTNIRAGLSYMAVFTDVPAGSHTFYPLWLCAGGVNHISQYASMSVTAIEL